jgi:hypothetical protein
MASSFAEQMVRYWITFLYLLAIRMAGPLGKPGTHRMGGNHLFARICPAGDTFPRISFL